MKNGIRIGDVKLRELGAEVAGPELRDGFHVAIWAQRNAAWWIGDLVVLALERYGDDAFEVLDVPVHMVDAVERWRAVAAKVPKSVRRDDVSWSHHAAVANLPHEEQRHVLARCADNVMTLREVQEYVRRRKSEDASRHRA